MKEILEELIRSASYAQALGLAALICIAQREQTSIAHQHDELNFLDISGELVSRCDALPDESQLQLAAIISFTFLSEKYA